jgi:hypothetical protein
MPHIRRLILTLLSFCLIGVAAKGNNDIPKVSLILRKFPIQSRRVVPRREELHIRGGNVVFEKRTIAQVASAVSFLQGCSCWLLPGRTCRTYGIDAQLIHEWAMRQVGIILLQFGLVGGCLFSKRCSLNTSIGVATLIRCAESCRCLLTNEPKILGFAASSHNYSLVLNGVLAYIALSSQPFADKVNKLRGLPLNKWACRYSTTKKNARACRVSVIRSHSTQADTRLWFVGAFLVNFPGRPCLGCGT